jgi:hypothetical protein
MEQKIIQIIIYFPVFQETNSNLNLEKNMKSLIKYFKLKIFNLKKTIIMNDTNEI